ncbi:DsbC family protein [Vibrio genomosp. F10]|uniref:DsbC family protein n=1 Tax=Vibrio genomosp. F10 TaxID=723171 RepID=UPI0002E34DFD|nr:DsbC family protein [Vibrio genomosp. F10]OEE95795.1 thiol:disulfide interchange protein [Vibrio genomosp. F10 str. 9ZD137]
MSVLRRLSILTLPFFVMACNAEEVVKAEEASTVQAEVQQAVALEATLAGQETSLTDESKQKIINNFAKLQLKVLDILPTQITGLYEVQTTGGVLYSSVDGEYFMSGTLYQHKAGGGYEDVLAKRQAPLNAAKLAALSDSVIEFKADNEKYVVTIFTDTTCGYCVRLHSQMNGYNDLGITVRYMAYPRQGPRSEVGEQMAAVWCADDPKAAMHDAKINRSFPEKNANFGQCLDTVVKHFTLGKSLGISGTPSIFLPSGEMIGGYLPPAKLLEQLQAQ